MCIPAFIKNLPLRALLLCAAAASAAILSAALVGQYDFNLHPCELCIAQRFPYAAIIVLGVISWLFIKSPSALHMIALLVGALFALDAAIAFYHAGVELHWFPGPSACTNTASQDDSLEAMRQAILNAPLVPCDQPMVQFFGLSMAAWNAFAASTLAIFTFVLLGKKSA